MSLSGLSCGTTQSTKPCVLPKEHTRLAYSKAGCATLDVSGASCLLEGELLTGADDENSWR